MKSYVILAALLVFGLVAMGATPSFAQETEEMEYSYGTVKSVSGNQIVVREYDYDKDEDVDINYDVDPAAKFDNVASIKDVAVDDIIEIDYITKDAKRIAKVIYIEKPVTEEVPVGNTEPAPGTSPAENVEY